jgi:hypothetical protein
MGMLLQLLPGGLEGWDLGLAKVVLVVYGWIWG